MEEAELLKERLLAITDKRKLQEEIAERRLRIEEEKQKLHHLQKKSLREKWLLDGLNTTNPAEQETTMKQNQEDHGHVRHLEQNIHRLEQEIVDLEKQETQLSDKEVQVLQRLKSVERTTEDIIKAVKAEVREEPMKDIYADIPDLPPSYKPSFIRRMEIAQAESGEEARKALFAMEIRVEKDMKTGKKTVISSIPVPSDEMMESGVKVYDDGRKSVYAVSSGGKMVRNGIDSLAPIEVEDLLRKATERSTQSPTEYHEPVFSNPYHSTTTHKGQVSPRLNGHSSPDITSQYNGSNVTEEKPVTKPTAPEDLRSVLRVITENGQPANVDAQHDVILGDGIIEYSLTEEDITKYSPTVDHITKYSSTADDITRYSPTVDDITRYPPTVDDLTKYSSTADDITKYSPTADDITKYSSTADDITKYPPTVDDITKYPPSADGLHYNIVHATPGHADDNEPVTMIFMGYKHADEDDDKILTDYEGVIRAELVVIDDEEEVNKEEEKQVKELMDETQPLHISPPPTPTSSLERIPAHKMALPSPEPYKNSISLQEQDVTLGPQNYLPVSRQSQDDGTEDPSLTALKIRMAKLGKKVI